MLTFSDAVSTGGAEPSGDFNAIHRVSHEHGRMAHNRCFSASTIFAALNTDRTTNPSHVE